MTAHTPGPWRIGTTEGAVVADVPIPEVEGSDHYEYYGGHLVAESIAPRNLPVIAAAPELLAEASAAEKMLSELLAALNKATELGATRVDVGDLRVAVEHRLNPLRAAIAKAEGRA